MAIVSFLPYPSNMATGIAILQMEMPVNLPRSFSVSLLESTPEPEFPCALYRVYTTRAFFSGQFLTYEISIRGQILVYSHAHIRTGTPHAYTHNTRILYNYQRIRLFEGIHNCPWNQWFAFLALLD